MKQLGLLALVIPSLSLLQRYGERFFNVLDIPSASTFTLFLMLLYIVIAIGIWHRLFSYLSVGGHLSAPVSSRSWWIIFVAAMLFIVCLFSVIYPLATAGVFGGGSDRDEALNIAVEALFSGNLPYREVTYVPGKPHELGLDGNPISPMPGALLLSAPFVAMGNSAYQIFFWLPLLVFVLSRLHVPVKHAVLVTLASLILCPALLHESLTGGDLLVNMIWVFIPVVILARASSLSLPVLIMLAIFFGVALSSRLNFLLVTPLVACLINQRFGLSRAIVLSSVGVVSYVAVTLPFYLWDPEGFSPLHAYSKLGRFDGILPGAGIVIPLLAGTLSVAFTVFLRSKPVADHLVAMGVVLLVPVMAGTVLMGIQYHRIDFMEFAWYAISGAYFLLWGVYSRYVVSEAEVLVNTNDIRFSGTECCVRAN
ncbi:Uncharacterised protein [BD1-7 clade bacterium]|uniref:Alpha-(1->6)-mannopyranosyltransferase A n=1 Tax=BD1-7 clade bacterium TaxID=2029982 RepID=A0A5S9PLD4_9GAMM|nr:Uncharacterised protein [BD1-7 clade bacterium]